MDLEIPNNVIGNNDNEINNSNKRDDKENNVSDESYVSNNEKIGNTDNNDNKIDNTNKIEDEQNSVSCESSVPDNKKRGAVYPLHSKDKKNTCKSYSIFRYCDLASLCNIKSFHIGWSRYKKDLNAIRRKEMTKEIKNITKKCYIAVILIIFLLQY